MASLVVLGSVVSIMGGGVIVYDWMGSLVVMVCYASSYG